jgi:UPF0755 protein
MKLKVVFRLLLVLVAAFLVLLMAGSFALSRYFASVGRELVNPKETLVEIPYGSSLRRVSEILKDAQVIENAPLFYWYLRLGRLDSSKIQAGYYSFCGELTKRGLAERLLLGKDQSFKVIFKEGQTLVDLATTLEGLGLSTKEDFILAMTNQEVLELIDAPNAHMRRALLNDVGGIEGYLFPDTYFFSKRDSAVSIIKKMYTRLIALLDDDILMRLGQEQKSLHEVLTLASIIEKETAAAHERPIIASVYRNRLKIGMRLQADPTVIYGIKNYNGKISKADLLAYHPYNTYKVFGLPPGPIAAPGLEAIRAALWPQTTKYIYFVSKNDGSHVFCENLTCHNRAVKTWQIDYFKKAAR